MEANYNQRWSDAGRCAGLAFSDPKRFDRIFFLKKGRPSSQYKKFCSGCPVQFMCFKYAVVNKLEGIWGNTTKSQRDRLPQEFRQKYLAEAKKLGYLEKFYVPKALAEEVVLAPMPPDLEGFLFDFEVEESLQKTG